MPQPYWQVLLTEWRKEGKTGFTLPFIIGSQVYLPASHTPQIIRELLEDILDTEGYPVYLTYCQDLNDLIVCQMDESKRSIPGTFFPYKGESQTQFFVTKFVEEGSTVEAIIERLAENYQSYIDDRQYSANDRERGGFSLDERNFLETCYKIFNDR